MKIFGINFETKKELRATIVELNADIDELESELDDIKEEFPFFIGQTVYDVALKDAKGRYTKSKPSLEYSTITAVTVDEKNYFKLVQRFRRSSVFEDQAEAEEFLESICK